MPFSGAAKAAVARLHRRRQLRHFGHRDGTGVLSGASARRSASRSASRRAAARGRWVAARNRPLLSTSDATAVTAAPSCQVCTRAPKRASRRRVSSTPSAVPSTRLRRPARPAVRRGRAAPRSSRCRAQAEQVAVEGVESAFSGQGRAEPGLAVGVLPDPRRRPSRQGPAVDIQIGRRTTLAIARRGRRSERPRPAAGPCPPPRRVRRRRSRCASPPPSGPRPWRCDRRRRRRNSLRRAASSSTAVRRAARAATARHAACRRRSPRRAGPAGDARCRRGRVRPGRFGAPSSHAR